MIDALYISATGLRSQQAQIDVISNNVANMQTPGFKKRQVNFAEIAGIGDAVAASQSLASNGGGSRILSTLPVFSEGELKSTQNATDLAIQGGGFFELDKGDGDKVYTRSGQFRIDAEGYLTSVTGLRLAQGIQIPPDAADLQVSMSGEVTARLGNDTDRTSLGVIELATFTSPDQLESVGDNAYATTVASGEPNLARPGDPGVGKINQGFLEMANVDLIEEMSALVMAQRAYQLNARVLQASDQILETINNLRR